MQITDKIKKEYRERLDIISKSSFDKNEYISDVILSEICSISSDINMEIAILIDRKGSIIDLSVGDKNSASLIVPDKESSGYSGFRVIHTHPNGNANLSHMDISFLKNKKLDSMCAVSIKNGMQYDAYVGYLIGDECTITYCNDARYINKYGLLDKTFEYEKEYIKYLKTVSRVSSQRAILCKVVFDSKTSHELDLDELENLAKTAGVEVVGRVLQNRQKPDSTYYIGKGKIDEIRDQIQLYNANLIIFDNELSGSKNNAISSALGVKVIDRSMLILDIFAGRARTNEGKLQVELAQLKYSLPRINAYTESMGRFGGGVGMRGPGETKLELNRRVIENNIIKKSEELKKLKRHRELNRKSRLNGKIPTVSIVGYTNSGKSTLLNLLAKSDVYVKDELFATLDTTTRNVWLDDGKEVLFTDTVGFISNLPHEFIEAFASTLEESIYSDLILHVVDISNPNYHNHIKVTNEVLNKLGCTSPIIMVYNKCDCIDVSNIDIDPDAIYISALKRDGIEKLKEKIIGKLF